MASSGSLALHHNESSSSNSSFKFEPLFWSYGHQIPLEPWAFTTKQTIITLMCAFGILSNMFIIVVIICVPSLRTYKTSIFITSLAAADFLVCTTVMTINSILQLNVTRLTDSQEHKMACQLWASLTIVACSSSSLNVCVISLDRYFFLLDTVLYERVVTRRRLRFVLLYIWLFSIALASPNVVDLVMVRMQTVDWSELDGKGTEICKLTPTPGYSIALAIVVILIPCVTVVTVNVLIFKVILDKFYLSDMSVIYRPRAESSPLMGLHILQRPAVHFDELRKIASSVDPYRHEEQTWAPTETTTYLREENPVDYKLKHLSRDDKRIMDSTPVDQATPKEERASEASIPPKQLSAFSAKLLLPPEQSNVHKSSDFASFLRAQWNTRMSSRSITYCEFKAGLSLFIIVTAYVVCWMPFGIMSIIDVYDPSLKISVSREVCLWLAYSNSCWNPIIYSLLNTNFRNALFKCLRSSIRRSRSVRELCCHTKKAPPIVLKRKKSDSHDTPTSFMLPLQSAHQIEVKEKQSQTNQQTDVHTTI